MMSVHQRAVNHAATASFYEIQIKQHLWQILMPHPATYNLEEKTLELANIASVINKYQGYHITISEGPYKGPTVVSFTQLDMSITSIEVMEDYRTKLSYLFDLNSDVPDVTVLIYQHGVPIATRKMLDIRDINNLHRYLPWHLLNL